MLKRQKNCKIKRNVARRKVRYFKMNLELKKHARLIVSFLLYVLLITYAARFCLKGLDHDAENSSIAILTIVLVFLCSTPKTFKLIFVCSIITALYAPVGLQFGGPTFQAVSSFLATDIKESLEFLALIPLVKYVKAVCIPLFLFLAYVIAKRIEIKPWRNKTLTILSFIALLILSKPTSFFSVLENSLNEVEKQKEELSKLAAHDNWGAATVYGGGLIRIMC